MNPRRQLVTWGSLLLGLALAEPVLGQYSEVRFGRPSDRGPSSRVGVTGGLGTRDFGVSPPQRGRRGDPSSVRLPSQQQLQRGSRLPPNLMPAAFLLGSPGFAFEGRTHNPFRLDKIMNPKRLTQISGLEKALRRQNPLIPRQQIYPIMAKGPYYAIAPNRDGFNGLFDLSPSPAEQPESIATPAEPIPTYGEMLERENAAHLQRTKDRAAIAFKKGTNPREDNQGEHLARAADLLSQIMRNDRADPMPALLSVHTALEKKFITLAQRSLLELVARDPEIFLGGSEVSKYFGDARTLENQMRRFRRIGDKNARDPSAWALQAYCNWVLGDPRGTQIAVQNMLQANRLRGNPKIRVFGYALSSALSAATD